MSIWYDKKGRSYASNGPTSWVKNYVEHLFALVSAQLKGHVSGTEEKHRAEDIVYDENTSLMEALSKKPDKPEGKDFSECDYTALEKEKLAGIAERATAVGISRSAAGSEVFNDPENTTDIPYAHIEGRKNSAVVKVFLMTDCTISPDFSFLSATLDGSEGITIGMPWSIFFLHGGTQYRYSGEIRSVSGNAVTATIKDFQCSAGDLPPQISSITPSLEPSFFGTMMVAGGSIGTHEVPNGSGDFSCHVEGYGNTGSLFSHAEGIGTTALGYAAHVEGSKASAIGDVSHAEGQGTIASSSNQHTQGRYNLPDTAGQYAHIVGNGNSDTNRSNAYTLDWEGNGRFAGKVYAENNKELATLEATQYSGMEGKTIDVIVGPETEQYEFEVVYDAVIPISENAKYDIFCDSSFTDIQVMDADGNYLSPIRGGTLIDGQYFSAVDLTGYPEKVASISISFSELYTGTVTVVKRILAISAEVKDGSIEKEKLAPALLEELTELFETTCDKPIVAGSGISSAVIWDDAGYEFGLTMKPQASGDGSFAANFETTASGPSSSAFGTNTVASGDSSFSLGSSTTASGNASFSSGTGTIAQGTNSCAQGYSAEARGTGSHAEGYYTVSGSEYQHVSGKLNIIDNENKYAFIIGNGDSRISPETGWTEFNRSNAYTLDWEGNGWYAGRIEADAIILRSSTEGSSKKFAITVSDDGTLKTELLAE